MKNDEGRPQAAPATTRNPRVALSSDDVEPDIPERVLLEVCGSLVLIHIGSASYVLVELDSLEPWITR